MRLPTLSGPTGIRTKLTDTWLCLPGESNIWDLNLQQCELDAAGLSRVIDSCNRLVRICIVWGLGMRGRPIDMTALRSTLRSTLQRHASSLTRLVLESDSGLPAQVRLFWQQEHSFGHGLEYLSRLRSLHIDENLLLGSDWLGNEDSSVIKLPASLRSLSISSQRAMRELPAIIQQVQPSLPDSLRRLSAVFRPGSDVFLNCLRYFSREQRY